MGEGGGGEVRVTLLAILCTVISRFSVVNISDLYTTLCSQMEYDKFCIRIL